MNDKEQPPESIYLQCMDEVGEYIGVNPHAEITWCQLQIRPSDVKYIRADTVDTIHESNADLLSLCQHIYEKLAEWDNNNFIYRRYAFDHEIAELESVSVQLENAILEAGGKLPEQ